MEAPERKSRSVFLLTISYRPEVGGVETRLDLIARTLGALGHRVLVYTYQPIITRNRGPGMEREGNVEIRRVRWIGFDLFHKLEKRPILQMLYLVPCLLVRAALFLLPRHRRFDVIHAAGFNAALAARVLSRLTGIPFIVSTHSTYQFVPGSPLARRVAWILRGAHRVLAVSSESASELTAIGVPRERIVTHTTWVDLERFRPVPRLEARRALGVPDGAFTAAFIGRLKEVKGVRLLLEAAARAPDIHFLFAGAGDLEEAVRQTAARLPNVHFAGYRDNADLAPCYSAADVFVLPSAREGFPRVAAEALACGTPVVLPDMPGIRSVIPEELAIYMEPSVEHILAALGAWRERFRADEGFLRGRARVFAEKRFSDRNVAEVTEAYGWGAAPCAE